MTIMRTIRPPESKQATTLLVAVRCRPLSAEEQLGKSKDIIRVLDDKVVVVLDPDDSKEYLDRVQNRSKEKKYVFDSAFRPEAKNQDIYKATVAPMVEGVIQGLNATIFAYGATGSGKTHTMVGTSEDPGLMVLSLREIFELVTKEGSDDFEVTCSYLEVYNEVIYDLLEKSSGHLELREDPDQGITAAGLKRIKVNSAEKILELLNLGNSRRKTESTEANATSSRSHAVLEIIVRQSQQNHYHSHVLHGKLALVDLAGSERASETMNAGQKLRDGANINKSLLALANCINALGKQQKKGLAYVPYRNSKLTRILKDGLSGNSRTVMVAAISCGSDQYHHTINTLKYADRAKEIKTHIQKNVGTLDSHIANYQRMIDNLQSELSKLRKELAEKETQLNVRPVEKLQDDELSWLDVLSQDISENVEERINLQKAIFELEDMNLRNRTELQQLDELVVKHQFSEDSHMAESLVERRKVVLDNVRDNDEAGAQYQHEIEINEAQRKELQQVIDEAISSNGNKTYLRILSQYRLLGMTNTELQFQIAVRDQIINNHREAISNLWQLLECSGLDHKQILELAVRQGITIEDWIVPSSVTGKACTPPTGSPLLSKPMHSTRTRKGMPPFPIIAQQMINTEGFLNRSIDLENLRAVQPESRSPVSRLLLMTNHMMESSPPLPPEVPKGGVEEGGNSSNASCTPSIFKSNTAAQSEMVAVDACSSQVSKPSSGELHLVRTAAYNCNSDQTFQKDSNNNNNNNNNKHPHVIHTFQDPPSLKNNGGLVKATAWHLFSNGLGIHCQSPRLEKITLEALEAPLGSRTKYV